MTDSLKVHIDLTKNRRNLLKPATLLKKRL